MRPERHACAAFMDLNWRSFTQILESCPGIALSIWRTVGVQRCEPNGNSPPIMSDICRTSNTGVNAPCFSNCPRLQLVYRCTARFLIFWIFIFVEIFLDFTNLSLKIKTKRIRLINYPVTGENFNLLDYD